MKLRCSKTNEMFGLFVHVMERSALPITRELIEPRACFWWWRLAVCRRFNAVFFVVEIVLRKLRRSTICSRAAR